MQNLKSNWVFISKWETWGILTLALECLKKFHFNVLLLRKVYIVWVSKVQRSYFSWNWRGIKNLERNRLVVSQLAWEIWQKVSKIFTIMSSFRAKYILLELKKYRGVISHETKEEHKIWKEIKLSFQIDIRNLTNFDLSTEKPQRFHINELLLSKVYIVWAKKVQRSYLSWSWRGVQHLESNRLVTSKLLRKTIELAILRGFLYTPFLLSFFTILFPTYL